MYHVSWVSHRSSVQPIWYLTLPYDQEIESMWHSGAVFGPADKLAGCCCRRGAEALSLIAYPRGRTQPGAGVLSRRPVYNIVVMQLHMFTAQSAHKLGDKRSG